MVLGVMRPKIEGSNWVSCCGGLAPGFVEVVTEPRLVWARTGVRELGEGHVGEEWPPRNGGERAERGAGGPD